ncbi:MAG: sensor domain-containing diguanylate cyclase [Bacilli bacterium]|jgi:diguanylate cyclase (GGDEF)-like protein/PAS domain S-box-containing protein
MDNNYESWSKDHLVAHLRKLDRFNGELKDSILLSNSLFLEEFRWAGNLGQWFWYYDENKILFNDKKTMTLGYDPKEMGETGFEFFTSKIHPDDINRVMENMRNHLHGTSPAYEVEYRIRHKDGHYVWYYDRGTVVKRDEHGQPLLLHGVVFDISESKKVEERLQYLAEHDALTGIYNRRMLFEHLQSCLEKKSKDKTLFSLIMFDIDRFKNVNDRFGHLIGDDTLVRLTQLVEANKRNGDTFYRYGGEEFFLLLPETDLQGAVILAQRIHEAVSNETFSVAKKVTISMGVVEFMDKESIDDVIKRVDDLLYDAKHDGRNTIKY